MRSMLALLAAAALGACASPSSPPQTDTAPAGLASTPQPGACMAEVALSPALVAEAGKFGWEGAAASGAAPAVLVGSLYYLRDDQELADGASGGVVFLRGAEGAWRAFLAAPTESVVGAFAAPAAGEMLFVTQLQIEGPGQSWTLARAGEADCVSIAFPAELNADEWRMESLTLVDLDIGADGRGELIGDAYVDRGGGEEVWHYLYRTADGGMTWSAPSRLSEPRAPAAARFEPLPEAPPALVAELTAFAAAQ